MIHRRTNVWITTAGAGLATALALLGAMNPVYGVGALVCVLGLAAFLRSGVVAVCGFTATTYVEVVGAYLGEALSPIKLAGGALVLLATVVLALRRRAATSSSPALRNHPALVGLLLAFVIWALASAAWASNLEQVRTHGTRLVTDVLIFLAVPVFLQTGRHLRALGWTTLGGGVLAVLYGLVTGAALGGRAIGTFSDPNEYAAGLVASMTVGLALAETSASRTSCWMGRLLAATCLLGVVQSGSRGGLLAAGTGLLVLLLTSRGRERVRMTGGLLLAVATGAAWLSLTPAGTSILARFTEADSAGRSMLWKVALRMYEQNPARGIGLGNYPAQSRHYLQGDVEHLELFLRAPRVVHSTPLELLAELGTIGALLYYLFVAGCLLAGYRAVRVARRLGDRGLTGAVRGLLAATCGVLATTIFLSGQYQELLWVLLAGCVAALTIARRTADAAATAAALETALLPDPSGLHIADPQLPPALPVERPVSMPVVR